MRLQGRTAIVTGGSAGIGYAVADALLGEGARVCVTGRDRERLTRAVARLGAHEERGDRVIGVRGSVGDAGRVTACVDETIARFGAVDIVINNAATNVPLGPLVEIPPEEWRDAFAVNVHGPLLLVRAAWHAWMREHGGSVVNVLTEGTHSVGPNLAAYETTKSALQQLTRHLAAELAPKVRVNAVSPGLIRTELARFVWENSETRLAAETPLGRIGEPSDIAQAVLWLVGDDASWVTGADLLVDGGRRVRHGRPAVGPGV